MNNQTGGFCNKGTALAGPQKMQKNFRALAPANNMHEHANQADQNKKYQGTISLVPNRQHGWVPHPSSAWVGTKDRNTFKSTTFPCRNST
jgi:hypothetical protein